MLAKGTLIKKADTYVAERAERGHVTIQEVGVIKLVEDYHNKFLIEWSGGAFELVRGDFVIEASAREKFNYKLGNATTF